MSMQLCCRDQRKTGQVIDQIKMLADNLDELRAEINALRTSYLGNKGGPLYGSDLEQSRSTKANFMHKLKKYMKKITSVYSLRRTQKSGKYQKSYYGCTNVDPPMPSFLNYVFRAGKKGDVWQIPTRVKYLRSQGNQTSEKFENQQSVKKHPTISMNVANLEDTYRDSFIARHANQRHDKVIFPTKNVTIVPKCSEISCELDLQVEDSEFNIFPDLYIFNNYPETIEVPSVDDNKQSATKSTQTKVAKPRRKSKNHFHPKHANLYFSKIKKAMITKKIMRNSNNSTFTVCGEINNRNYNKHHSYKKKRNSFAGPNDRIKLFDEQNYPPNKSVQMLKNKSPASNETVFQSFISEGEPDLSSSSASVGLKVNISNSSNSIGESRRKPRTYVVRKQTQKHGRDNWLNHFESSVIYVGQCSDLSLSSYSFSNHNVRSN